MIVEIESPGYVRLLGVQFENGERRDLPDHLVRVLCKAGVGRDPTGKIATNTREVHVNDQVPVILDNIHVYMVSIGIWVNAIADERVVFSIREQLEKQRRPGRRATFSDDELSLIEDHWKSVDKNRGQLIRALELGQIEGIDPKKAFSQSTVDRLIRVFKA